MAGTKLTQKVAYWNPVGVKTKDDQRIDGEIK
jgi:hypothetical protein